VAALARVVGRVRIFLVAGLGGIVAATAGDVHGDGSGAAAWGGCRQVGC
jgi:hypothetical protein